MTATTQTLADFLLARIVEDEAVAKAATPGPWTADDNGCCIYSPEVGILAQVAVGGGDGTDEDVIHIARHDPARVLAECAAKRRIVEAVRRQVEDDDPYIPLPNDVLRALASVYADHAEFREEWRP